VFFRVCSWLNLLSFCKSKSHSAKTFQADSAKTLKNSRFKCFSKKENKICARELILFIKFSRLNKQKGNFYRRRKKMRNQENQLGANDIGLLVFVLVAGWLLLFQSELFQ
jgi:hypothetical protein